MKTLALGIAVLLLAGSDAAAQTSRRREGPVPPDAMTVESIVAGYYASLSHAPEATPNFDRMRQIFLYVGMIIPPKKNGGDDFSIGDVDQFEERYGKSSAALKEKGDVRGLVDHEIARRTDCFGNVCQVFSTYESRHTANDAKPFERGVTSLQLVRDGRRWWIASAAWEVERPDAPIPAAYLPVASAN
jgi:hypothetical protein